MEKNMGRIMRKAVVAVSFAAVAAAGVGCAEEGESGEAALDCGEHGTEHDGHCHCDDGWLFDGTTCVTPSEITEPCGEDAASDAGEEDHHEACLCPDVGDCPCDEGTVEEYGGAEYCVPALDEDE